MDALQFEARLKELDPRLEKIYSDAKRISQEAADAHGDDFELSAMIVRLFWTHFARTGQAAADQTAERETNEQAHPNRTLTPRR